MYSRDSKGSHQEANNNKRKHRTNIQVIQKFQIGTRTTQAKSFFQGLGFLFQSFKKRKEKKKSRSRRKWSIQQVHRAGRPDGVIFPSQSKRQCAAARRPNQSRLRMGGPATPPSRMAAGARKWLEEAGVAFDGSDRRAFNALPLTGVRVSLAEGGRAVCSLRVPAELTDAEGNWHPGAIAAAADDVCAAAIMSVEGIIKVSVHYDISYFSPAKYHEEVELDGRVVEQKGKMTAVTVEIRKKDSGELVAIGRQWMSTTRPKEPQASSKL
ncbi:uncharacterized protein LOC102699642 isoform X2 [Oryza brachyantha]|uniref:uncharacterized protein LOC102699642 isoform X2 n=1 Tax=Oryza brachyantha TaxID=4533 RepID=UPI001ADA55C1|nr:uncharacterized protein LOC102699642 isoform X2 [Oryza brachyantha]